MTLALKMADIEYDAYENGFERGHKAGLQVGIQQGIERGIKQGLEQGVKQGAYQTKLETAKTLLSMGLSPEQVAQGTNLPLETILQLVQEN